MQVAKRDQVAQGNFLGFLNVCIGRRIQTKQGELISSGVTWGILAQDLTVALTYSSDEQVRVLLKASIITPQVKKALEEALALKRGITSRSEPPSPESPQ